MTGVSEESDELPSRLQAVNGIKSGAHAPVMENLISAFAEKEKLFKEVRQIVQGFEAKY